VTPTASAAASAGVMAAALPFAVLAAAANVLGAVAVTARSRWSVRSLETMIALSAGFMISVAVADVLPEAIERGGRRAATVATLGFLLVHLTQHTFARHFHFGEETHHVTPLVSASALVGLLLHTFVDGVAIASGFAADRHLGLLLSSAILLHKLPEGLAISSLFLASGAGRGRALAAASMLGLATLAGVGVAAVTPLQGAMGLALSAGVTLYVAAANLVPEVQGKQGWRLPIAFFLGSGLYFAAREAFARVGGGH
jgi:ZIP family zinc transporter/zinc and cadmium transporter